MKRYRAIFFDWDGTAVQSRRAPADGAAKLMGELLSRGVYLFVISGTVYQNIDFGRLHERFAPAQLERLGLGLARGAYNYAFDKTGVRYDLTDPEIPMPTLLAIHDVAYQLHRHLLEHYRYPTDIIFDRPHYCKIDILNRTDRSEQLYMSGGEIEQIAQALDRAGFAGGVPGLFELALRLGRAHGLTVKPTCDAKYLEVGVTTKADNVDALMRLMLEPAGIRPEECCFWGDEFLEIGTGVWGSDSYMMTPLTRPADFFDVGEAQGLRPAGVVHLGGGVEAFRQFLSEQIQR